MRGDELRLLTWNVDGLDETRLSERMEGLCLHILVGGDLARAASGAPLPPVPHVVLLQEIVKVGHRGFFLPHLRAAGFTVWPETTPDEREYYELVAVRAPYVLESAERILFDDSPLRRAATIATVRHAQSGVRVRVITAHMESLRGGEGPRTSQARQIGALLAAHEGPAVFGGDTNLRDAEWDEVKTEMGVDDAFERLGSPASAKVTWRSVRGGASARYDRVWVRGGATPVAMTTRNAPRLSDHRGLEVVLRVSS